MNILEGTIRGPSDQPQLRKDFTKYNGGKKQTIKEKTDTFFNHSTTLICVYAKIL